MIRFLIFVILTYIAYRTVKAIFRPKDELPGGQDRGVIDEMVQDPQCETYVPKREAVKRTIAGKTHFFCSGACADKFQKGL
jgi:uncharacterized protein